jgi:hypothetical protein
LADDQVADQCLAAPVLGDEREQPVVSVSRDSFATHGRTEIAPVAVAENPRRTVTSRVQLPRATTPGPDRWMTNRVGVRDVSRELAHIADGFGARPHRSDASGYLTGIIRCS